MGRRVVVALALVLLSACAQLPTANVNTADNNPTAESTLAAHRPANAVTPTPPTRIAAVHPPKLLVPPPAPVLQEPKAKAAPKDLWERIRRGFRLPPMHNRYVRYWEHWYADRPDYVNRMIERSSRYLYHVEVEVERRHMPSEITLLPMVESAYNPVAYSRSNASGIWQFIPSTGKLYGLRQNFWYDGRRDIIAATNAALDYLQNLHAMLGSWELALAAYNWGEGAVARAVAYNKAHGRPTNYESLPMPAETREYLPKLIALKHIIEDPARFGLHLADIPNKPYFQTVKLKRHIDVRLAAELAEIPLSEFKSLNPAHNKRVIRSKAGETIVLPVHHVQLFLNNLKSYDEPLVTWQIHTMRRGESAVRLARHYGMTLADLKEINGLHPWQRITAGEPLLVPARGKADPYLPDLPARPARFRRTRASRYARAHRREILHRRYEERKRALARRRAEERARYAAEHRHHVDRRDERRERALARRREEHERLLARRREERERLLAKRREERERALAKRRKEHGHSRLAQRHKPAHGVKVIDKKRVHIAHHKVAERDKRSHADSSPDVVVADKNR